MISYYRGLKEWNNEKGYLTDTCLTAQDKYKVYLDYSTFLNKFDERLVLWIRAVMYLLVNSYLLYTYD